MDLGGTRVRLAALGAVAMVLAGCGSLFGGGGDARTVLVDYQHDEIASSFIAYFPKDVRVHPGDKVVFTQKWTGEPHTVTMGTLVDDMMGVVLPLFERYEDVPDDQIPPEAFQQYEEATAGLPGMLSQDVSDGVSQNAAQPCYLTEGGPPEDPTTPCSEEQQVQPPFDGTQSYYNSGFIPYEGPRGNTFEVQLADDIAPGTYNYYCNVHGPFQAGTITVVPEDQAIPSQQDVSRQALEEIDAMARPLLEGFERVKAGDATMDGETIQPPIAGWFTEDPDVHAFVSEFHPREFTVSTGEKVTWSVVGGHTVSFDVPPYFSQLTVEEDGTVVYNPHALLPVGGPGHPEVVPAEEDGAASEAEPPPDDEGSPSDGGGPPPPVEVDAGEWDGDGFLSSGLFFDGRYSITFTRPGTYQYACLIHPQMVGTLVVE